MLNILKRKNKPQVIKTPLLKACKNRYRVVRLANDEYAIQLNIPSDSLVFFPAVNDWYTLKNARFSSMETVIKMAIRLYESEKERESADVITTIYEGE